MENLYLIDSAHAKSIAYWFCTCQIFNSLIHAMSNLELIDSGRVKSKAHWCSHVESITHFFSRYQISHSLILVTADWFSTCQICSSAHVKSMFNWFSTCQILSRWLSSCQIHGSVIQHMSNL